MRSLGQRPRKFEIAPNQRCRVFLTDMNPRLALNTARSALTDLPDLSQGAVGAVDRIVIRNW